MATREKPDMSNVALEILTPDTKEYSWTLRIVPQCFDPEDRRWHGIYSYGSLQCLEHLQLRCYQNPEHPDRETYAWYAEYTESYSIRLDSAERMYKTLAGIAKGLERARDHDGECTTFGHYCLRVARALGIKTFIRPSPWGGYQLLPLADGQYAIDEIIRDWREDAKSKASAAAD